jgi:hypothetical protein
LAHHIVLSEDELVVEGPAWLLALAGFHITQWYTPPINFPLGRPVPTISLYGIPPQTCRQKIARERLRLDPQKMSVTPHKQISAEILRQNIQLTEEQIASADFPTSPCPTWQDITGDAGWGGVLTEAARNRKEAAIIYPQNMNPLPLFVEALAILPAQFLWNTTFTTYYIDPNNNDHNFNSDSGSGLSSGKLESNKNFRPSPKTQQQTQQQTQLVIAPHNWKAVVEGSPEAETLKKRNDILIIDLTRKPVEPPEGIFVKYAKTGEENDLPVETHYSQYPEPNETNTTNNPNNSINMQNNNTNNPAQTNTTTTNINQNNNNQNNAENITFEPNADKINLSLQPQPQQQTTDQNPTDQNSQLPPLVPNIITKNTTNSYNKINRSSQLTNQLLNRLVRSLTKNQFYLVYIIALIIIICLLLVVMDQIAELGFTQSLFGQKKITPDNHPAQIIETINANNNSDETKNEPAKTTEQIKIEQHQQKLTNALIEINKKRKETTNDLNKFIRNFAFPPYLPLKPPTIKNDRIILPKNDVVFNELSQLYKYGLALNLEWTPLWDFGDKKIETRKLKFNIGDKKNQNNETENNENENENKNETETENDNTADKLSRKKFVRYRAVKLTENKIQNTTDNNNNINIIDDAANADVNNNDDANILSDEITLPDTNRFEWEVVAIIPNKKSENNKNNNDENNKNDENQNIEIKLFHLKLEEDGLHIKWELSGMTPANFYDTLRVSLGFLRFSVEHFDGDETGGEADGEVDKTADNKSDNKSDDDKSDDDKSQVNSNVNIRNDNSANEPEQFEYYVQLFEPVQVSPVSPFAVFTDKSSQFRVPTPFAVTPWDTLFREDNFEYKFNFDVKVQPNVIAGISTKIKKEKQTQPVEIEFTTHNIEARRRKSDGSTDEYFPLQTRFMVEAASDSAAIVWTDAFNMDLEMLQNNLESAQIEVKRLEKELNGVRQKLWNFGNTTDKDGKRKELEKVQSDLEKKNTELSNYDFEVNSRIKNLPESHKAIKNNKEINFEYSVYLTTGENKRELLIITTSNKLTNEKINKK